MAKPMAGRRLAPELRHQAVVTAAGADRVLGAQRIGDPLEHRARVVIEPAHQPRIERYSIPARVQSCAHSASKCALRLRIQVSVSSGAAAISAHPGILAVQDAQRIAAEAPPAVLIQRALVLREILHQLLAVRAARLRRAQGIDLQLAPS